MTPLLFKYIYGPVFSWRLGRSLGVDLLSKGIKVCSFDCIYCQLGKTRPLTTQRKVYVPTQDIIREIKALPKIKIDYITFSGRGEPTLAKNLGEAIQAIKQLRPEPIAVLTNATLLHRKDVRRELAPADLVAVKLDAHSEQALKTINSPAKKLRWRRILRGIRQFRKKYSGKLALQIMFMPHNKDLAKALAKLAKSIGSDEIQICTPIRPARVKALSREDILLLKRYFAGMPVFSVYDIKRQAVRPLNKKAARLRRVKIR